MSGLRDSSGTIVIDEAEAEEDIRKIEIARSKLNEAKEILNPGNIDGDRMFGAAHDALEEQLTRIGQDLLEWDGICEGSIKYIRHVVAEYQRMDREFAKKAKELK